MKTNTNIFEKYKGADFNVSPEAAQVLRNAYLLLAGTLVPTVFGVFLGMAFPFFSYMNPWVALGLYLVVSLYSIFAVHANKDSMTGNLLVGVFDFSRGLFYGAGT